MWYYFGIVGNSEFENEEFTTEYCWPKGGQLGVMHGVPQRKESFVSNFRGKLLCGGLDNAAYCAYILNTWVYLGGE
jgi:hypothetical protein